MTKSIKIVFWIIALFVIALLIIIFTGSQIYTDWLWFKNLGFSGTFVTMFFTNFWLRLVIGIIFSIFIFLNLSFTKKPLINFLNYDKGDNVESLFKGNYGYLGDWLTSKRLNYIYILGSIILGFLFSSINQDLWKIVLNYLNRTPFGTTDPIFNRDIGFYVFSLPFLNFLREMGMVLVILTLIVTGVIYTIASGISSLNDMKFKLSGRAKGHLTILLILFLLLKALGYRLSMYNLLFSPRGVVFGAGYTDIHANLLGLKILFVIALLIAVLLFVNLFKKSYKILIWGLGFWLIASFIFGTVYPGLIQRFEVEPNEISKESKYISYNIDMTLKAYDLDDIEEKSFTVQNNLTPEVLQRNQGTINNIRLWDSRPLLSTYSQLQELRQYYSFPDVDIDRYHIDGHYQQVMLAPRELDQSRLSSQAQTWINQVLKYTHGYGIVMNPVNRVTTEGLPYFYIKDIPPVSSIDIQVVNPAIYYGEKTNNYVIVNNKAQEFDYPVGSQNAYVNYQGTGGVQLNNFFKKLVFAIKHSNIKFLLADDITTESRIMYYRNIKERVRKAAPFLIYDNDPYLVIVDGRLFWIQDAYTITNRYPYAQPFSISGNYIRNSIKVIIDAYHGTMKYYIVDQEDPLARTYQKIFPDLFIPGEEMPEAFKQHLRYPQDLFEIQTRIYSIYHMTDPTVFYNKEDLWNIPNETYAGSSIPVEPYYIIIKLPGEEKEEFVLMLPFTPVNKNNMIAWMAARSDGENYGEILVYRFPKDKLIYGPMQIESRIDQDAEISQLLTLWGQRGSQVIRGNLLVIPIEDSLLYVEPIYLQAETSRLPEMKRVVVAYEDKIVMKESFDEALKAIFGLVEPVDIEEDEDIDTVEDEAPASIKKLTSRALELYQNARESAQNGDWASYGEYLDELEDILERLNNLNQE
jgi:hypothetical protein